VITVLGPTGIQAAAWLVPVLPVVAAGITLFFGTRTPGRGAVYTIVGVGASFVMSLVLLVHFVQGGGPYAASIDWFTVGSFHLQVGMYIDGLTAVMFVVVTTVSLCVHVYSLGYMHGDTRFTWFYVVLSLFTGAMLDVVIADNLFQLLIGWEVMGVCSYLLIGHWFEDHTNSSSAIKAFITTRVGDVPFMFGIFCLILATGTQTSNIREVGEAVARPGTSSLLVGAAALLLFGGTIGKSAQFPLYTWLPDAMAGPTPVSALIHAATMVAAGVYLVGRMFDVFLAADPAVLTVVSAVGAITLVLAAFLALVQYDIKRVLAYSTVSQLAYMVAALGLGEVGFAAGLFHLFTHAFFKALLFLGAGSVIHAVHSNDMRDMGGLRKAMPITFWTFLIGGLALAGIPPLAGFFSKDEIVIAALHDGPPWLSAAILAGAFLTAFYTVRMLLMAFGGLYRGKAHLHESPPSMVGPLVVLALATVSVGFLGFGPVGAPFFDWVFVGSPEAVSFDPAVASLSVAVAGAGLLIGYAIYRRYRVPDPITRLGPAYTVLENKYYLDDVYFRGVVKPVRDQLSAAVYWTNQHVLDGAVNGAAVLTRAIARAVAWIDRTIIDGAYNGAGKLTGVSGGLLKYVQSGNVQWYAAGLFLGVAALTVVFIRVA
jgi:NADH-quinone oxidoreductase subunit L